jgi:hypothetical protein
MEMSWLQSPEGYIPFSLYLLVRKGNRSEDGHRTATALVWPDLRSREKVPQDMSTSVRPTVPRRPLSTMLCNGSQAELFLR